MSLSVQNKNFLALLHKLGINLDIFPDKTFDGLFDNVPKEVNYFFNWLMDNITTDNVLTELEESMYFELEKNHLLPTEKEVDYAFSSYNFNYEDLLHFDVNYLNFLVEDLEDIKRNHEELSDIYLNLESQLSEVKKKHNGFMENISKCKKQLSAVKNECHSINLLYRSKLDDIKKFLLTDPDTQVDFNSYTNLVKFENELFNKLENFQLVDDNDKFTWSNVALMPKIKEELSCVDSYLIFSEGSLKEKKARAEVLSDILSKKFHQKSFDDSLSSSFILLDSQNLENSAVKVTEDIQNLEKELQKKVKELSHYEIQKISEQYLLKKMDLKKTCISNLTTCRNYVKLNYSMELWLHHILLKSINSLNKTCQMRREIRKQFNEKETNCSNYINHLSMRKQRFKEVSSRVTQHPFLMALKNVLNPTKNYENNELSMKKITEFLSFANDDSNFVSQRFRTNLKSSIMSVFDRLCGPTSQLLFVPIDLLNKFQICQLREKELSHEIKRLANKYVEAKESISKSDRKLLLLWIDFVTNPQALELKIKNLQDSYRSIQNE